MTQPSHDQPQYSTVSLERGPRIEIRGGGRDAVAGGYSSVAEVVADLRGSPDDPVYLLRLHYADEPDPRDELASDAGLSTSDIHEISRRLARLDKTSRYGPWTESTLDIIRRRPAVRAGNLAEAYLLLR